MCIRDSIHIVESASAKVIGAEAQDHETQEDKKIMDHYLSLFLAKGLKAEGKIGFKNRVKAIAQIVTEEQADLLIVGSHGPVSYTHLDVYKRQV